MYNIDTVIFTYGPDNENTYAMYIRYQKFRYKENQDNRIHHQIMKGLKRKGNSPSSAKTQKSISFV